MNKHEKIYCYADETGQDTIGELFVVGLVILDKEKDCIEQLLSEIEQTSGKHTKKWQKTRKAERLAYINKILGCKQLEHALFYCQYDNAGKEYLVLTIYSLSKLILTLDPERQKIISIIVDALTLRERQIVGQDLRRFGIRTGKIRGKRDESSPMVRLADALAGFVRDGLEKNSDYLNLFNRAVEKGKINKIT